MLRSNKHITNTKKESKCVRSTAEILISRVLKGQRLLSKLKPPPSYQPEYHAQSSSSLYNRNSGGKRTMLLHDRQELDDDLGARSDQDLTLASLFGVVDALESVVENGGLDHFGGM